MTDNKKKIFSSLRIKNALINSYSYLLENKWADGFIMFILAKKYLESAGSEEEAINKYISNKEIVEDDYNKIKKKNDDYKNSEQYAIDQKKIRDRVVFRMVIRKQNPSLLEKNNIPATLKAISKYIKLYESVEEAIDKYKSNKAKFEKLVEREKEKIENKKIFGKSIKEQEKEKDIYEIIEI